MYERRMGKAMTGHTVAVDETLVAKRKPGNQQGRPVATKWVFGAVDLGTGDFFMEIVDQHDAAHLEQTTSSQERQSGAINGRHTTTYKIWAMFTRL